MNITRAQLVDCISRATSTMKVHVPCQDYYARRGDSQEEQITYVDPEALVEALMNLEED